MPLSPYVAWLRSLVGHRRLLLPSVSAHVFDGGGRLLLVRQRDGDHWSTPGGLVEPDEGPLDAVVRELLEETGLEARVVAVLDAYGGPECVVRYDNGDETQYVVTAIECEVHGGEPRPDGDETTEVRFVARKEAETLPLSPWLRANLDAVFRRGIARAPAAEETGHASRAGDLVAAVHWRRLDAAGHDACRLFRIPGGGALLHGHATWAHRDGPAALSYRVLCDADWHTVSGSAIGFVGGRDVDATFREVSGWAVNGERSPGLPPGLDLDFGFTPATNYLQLRRLRLAIGESRDCRVAWWDPDEPALSELVQRYERRGERTYWYEAPRFGYSGVLEIGSDGFADVYPKLWEREP